MTVTLDIAAPGVLNLLRDMEKLRLLRFSTPIAEAELPAEYADNDCPLCAIYHEPNEKTIAVFEEGEAMMRGEIPAIEFESAEAFLADLKR